jgi:hypothetical protein
MGLLDLFKKKPEAVAAPEQTQQQEAAEPSLQPSSNQEPDSPVEKTVAQEKELYTGDLSKTAALFELAAVPHEQRDENWGQQFLLHLAGASFKCGEPQVIKGPDGFPYVQLYLPTPGESFQSYVIEKMKDDFLLEQGFGVVINPVGGRPDWVLTYGDIVNLHINNTFYTRESNFSRDRTDEVIQGQEEVLVAQPSEALLPKATRNVLSEYLKINGLTTPKVLLMMRGKDDAAEMMQDLAFNATPADFESEEQFRNVMQSIGWFLPNHYSFVALNENTFDKGFEEL